MNFANVAVSAVVIFLAFWFMYEISIAEENEEE